MPPYVLPGSFQWNSVKHNKQKASVCLEITATKGVVSTMTLEHFITTVTTLAPGARRVNVKKWNINRVHD